MSISRGYVANHKFWDEMGRVTPNVEWSESHRPHAELAVAPWLPTQRLEEENKTYIVISAGKVVGLDRRGNIVPAGLRKAWNALIGSGSAALTYTATDVTENVIDLTTGVAVTTATSYTEAQLTAALKERGLIRATEKAMDLISKPVGIASYNVYKASGPDHYNPATLYQHNWRPQALVAITCDYVATYPVVPAVATTETMDGALANDAGSIDWTSARTGGWFGSTAINGLVAYSSLVAAGDNVVCYVMENWPVSYDTTDTPIEASVSGLTNLVSSVTAINSAGDYFIDYSMGLLFLYEAGGDAIPSPWSVSATITYYHYASAGTPTTTYACATGAIEYGDFLTYDSSSNLIKATLDISAAEGYNASLAAYSDDPAFAAAASPTDDEAISLQLENAISGYLTGIVGQCIGTVSFPRDYLDRVRSAYQGQTAANMRTPGSATGGRTDQLTYAGAGEKMAIINLIFR